MVSVSLLFGGRWKVILVVTVCQSRINKKKEKDRKKMMKAPKFALMHLTSEIGDDNWPGGKKGGGNAA